MIPKTITDLIAQFEAKGGEAVMIQDRLWEFSLPRQMVDGTCPQVVIGRLGYYVTEEGKNRIGSSIHDLRQRLAMHR